MTDEPNDKAAEAWDVYVAAREALRDARRAADAAVGDAWDAYEAAAKAALKVKR